MSFPDIHRYPYIGLDTETTGLRYPVDRVWMVSMALPTGEAFSWRTSDHPVLNWLQQELKNYRGRVVAHHAKFDWLMLKATGCEFPPEVLDCTMVRACLIDEHLHEYNLDTLLTIYTDVHKLDPNVVGWDEYAKADAIGALRLWEAQEKEIKEQDLRDICDFERSVFPSICRANARGIRVDLDAAERAMANMTPLINESQAELNKLAGWELNVNSGPQIKKLFAPVERGDQWFVGDDLIGRTGSGGPSLKAEFLRELSHPAAEMIINHRSMLKTRDTFLAKHILEHAVGDRVYPTINQNKGEDGGTGTGRLSYVDPAMQQIPSRNKKVASVVKPCFLPDEGEVWVDLDQASFEVRIFAHLANDAPVIEAYKANPQLDFHQKVADLTNLVRNATYSGEPNSKQLNLSMIFNQGKGATAKKMGMPWEWDSFQDNHGRTITYMKAGPEATAVIEKYHRMLPGVSKLAKGCRAKAEERGYIRTRHGRHLRFPRKLKTYKASGLLIQATSADINKEMWKLIDEMRIKLLLNTHDSYGLSLPAGSGEETADMLQQTMAERLPWVRVPLILELNGEGANWWEAIKGT